MATRRDKSPGDLAQPRDWRCSGLRHFPDTGTRGLTHMTMIGRTFAAFGVAGLALMGSMAAAQEKTDFKIAWSIYVGWMPWGYAEEAGIVDK